MDKKFMELIENAEIVEKEDGKNVLSLSFKKNQTEEEAEIIKKTILDKLK